MHGSQTQASIGGVTSATENKVRVCEDKENNVQEQRPNDPKRPQNRILMVL